VQLVLGDSIEYASNCAPQRFKGQRRKREKGMRAAAFDIPASYTVPALCVKEIVSALAKIFSAVVDTVRSSLMLAERPGELLHHDQALNLMHVRRKCRVDEVEPGPHPESHRQHTMSTT